MIKPKNTTLKDVADECGLTVQTVSRILNSNLASLYHADTVRKVRKVAENLGYRPNAFAQFIKSGKFHSVSLLLFPYISYSSFPNDYLIIMEQELSRRNYNLLLNVLPEKKEFADNKIPRIFRENLVDGVLVGITHSIPLWLESLIKTLNVPIVWIGSKHKKDCVHHDDFGAAYKATLDLVKKGHKNIAYIDLAIHKKHKGPLHFSVLDRENGYLSALKDAGLKANIIRSQYPIEPIDLAKFAKDVLSGKNHPSAFLAYDFVISGRSLMYAGANLGLKIPDDFELICFNDQIIIENSVQIPSIIPRKTEIVRNAVNILFEKIENKKKEHPPLILPFYFIYPENLKYYKEEKNNEN